jgi:hypothetical protein
MDQYVNGGRFNAERMFSVSNTRAPVNDRHWKVGGGI